MKNCSKVLYFEGRKKKDLYITMADIDEGPTIRFNVEGLNTMGELKFSGNCLKVKFYETRSAFKVIIGLSTAPRVRRALRRGAALCAHQRNVHANVRNSSLSPKIAAVCRPRAQFLDPRRQNLDQKLSDHSRGYKQGQR